MNILSPGVLALNEPVTVSTCTESSRHQAIKRKLILMGIVRRESKSHSAST